MKPLHVAGELTFHSDEGIPSDPSHRRSFSSNSALLAVRQCGLRTACCGN